MDAICRLCSSTKFVNNDIFDEENALFLKMSLYLPIKVLKNDLLPQKICDKCSCKVNDFYQFCNEAIEVQARLRSILFASGVQIKESINYSLNQNTNPLTPVVTVFCEQGTQTDANIPSQDLEFEVKIKEEKLEPMPVSPPVLVKFEDDYSVDESCGPTNGLYSDDSEDFSLLSLREIKKNENDTDKSDNDEIQENKGMGKLKVLETLINSLPETIPGAIITSKTDTLKVEKELLDVHSETKTTTTNVKKKVRKGEIPQDAYQCCICLQKFDKRPDILQHYKSHAVPITDSVEVPPTPPPPTTRPLKCPRCKKCLQESEWGLHWRRHWDRDRQPFRCGLCEKTFRDSYQLFRHGLGHEGGAAGAAGAGREARFMCDACEERFVFVRCLLAHRARAHPEWGGRAAALRCPRCARAFAHSNSLRRHLRSHTGERNFLCSECGKALSSAEHLKYHARIHAGYKPNVCRTCGKGFAKKCNLTLHERVHSGERPHVCSHCGKAFSQRSTLVIHERYHSGARPYECAVCGRGFVSRGLLTMHLKSRCFAPGDD